MDFRPLEHFLRVAEFGSINRAALELAVSQPSLSRQIVALERELGTELFTRSKEGVRLTEAGRLLADRARPVLRQWAELREQVGEQAAGQLAFGVPPSWQYVFTLDFITEFTKQHPQVKLRVHEGVSHTLREQILGGLLDLAVVPFETSPPEGYAQTVLIREPLVLVGGRRSGLIPDRPVPASKLNGMNLILPGRPNLLRKHIEHTLGRRGLNIRVPVEANTVSLCLNLAKLDIGHSVVPSCAVLGESPEGDVRWSPVKGLYLTWVLCTNVSRSHSQAVRAGQRLIENLVGKIIASGRWVGADRP